LHQMDGGNRFLLCSQKGVITNRDFDDSSLTSFDISRPVERFRFCNETNQFIVSGGRNQLSQVFDLEKQSEIWKAKNVPHDFLDMQVPIWDRDVTWLNEPAGRTFIAVTAYHQIRLYDIRAQKNQHLLLNLEIHQ